MVVNRLDRLHSKERNMSENSFPSTSRLRQAHEFNAVFKHCEYRVSNRSLLFLAIPNALQSDRLGMVVSKKSVPRAVDRNRIKRQIRETFRTLNNRATSLDVVVLTRTPVRHEEQLPALIHRLFMELIKEPCAS